MNIKNNILIASLMIGSVLTAQVTEAEGDLKKKLDQEETGWKTGGLTNLNLSQTSLVNWAAGGENSVSASGLVSLFANKKTEKYSWANSLDLGYGLLFTGQGDDGTTVKTDDKIDFTSKYGQQAFDKWYYAALVNAKTQFANGYNYPNDSVAISKFFAPAYVVGALGLDYIADNESFSLFIAPVTAKMTFVADDVLANAGAFGVDSGKHMRTEIGGYLKASYKTNLMEGIDWQTKLDLFSNYAENPEYVDVSWENLISFKVNKYISASITTHLLYDHDVEIGKDTDDDGVADEFKPRIQFKEVLGIGLAYSF